jgi:hypothetical protein
MGNIDLLVDRIKDAVGPNLDDQKDLRDKLLAGSPFTLRDMCALAFVCLSSYYRVICLLLSFLSCDLFIYLDSKCALLAGTSSSRTF